MNRSTVVCWLCCLLSLTQCGGEGATDATSADVATTDAVVVTDTTPTPDSTTTLDSTTADTSTSTLQWYKSCGAPSCGPNVTIPPGTPSCSADQQVGKSCTQANAVCDAGLGCGALLICSGADPRNQVGGCPISSRDKKRQIHYLTPAQLTALHTAVRGIKLATYQYKHDLPRAPRRLGFIMEDQPQSPCVDRRREVVDLYGYTSMAIAALQVQAAQIDALKRELRQLKQQMKAQQRPAPRR